MESETLTIALSRSSIAVKWISVKVFGWTVPDIMVVIFVVVGRGCCFCYVLF